MASKRLTIRESHEELAHELEQLVRCIRNFELGDFSPLMDEIFDSEHALRRAKRFRKRKSAKTLVEIFGDGKQ